MASVELDYILEADTLRDACQHDDFLTDGGEMLMRLRLDTVEVFGQTEDAYHAWQEHLRRNNLPLHVPSSAWLPLSVIWIATSVEEAFTRLREEGHSDLLSLASAIHLEQQGETVAVYLSRERVGQALLTEVHAAFVAFAERVRDDFLALCPQLTDHATLGYWFRREDAPPPQVSPPPILL